MMWCWQRHRRSSHWVDKLDDLAGRWRLIQLIWWATTTTSSSSSTGQQVLLGWRLYTAHKSFKAPLHGLDQQSQQNVNNQQSYSTLKSLVLILHLKTAVLLIPSKIEKNWMPQICTLQICDLSLTCCKSVTNTCYDATCIVYYVSQTINISNILAIYWYCPGMTIAWYGDGKTDLTESLPYTLTQTHIHLV